MKKEILRLFFILTFALPLSTWASAIQDYDSQVKYEKASDLCHSFTSSNVLEKLLTVLETHSTNVSRGIKTAITDNGLKVSKEISSLVESPEYARALTECFGPYAENADKWKSLTYFLKLSDAAGRTVGYVGSITAVGKFFKVIGSLSSLSKLRALEGYFVANPRAIIHLKRTSLVLVSGATLKMGYDSLQEMRLLFDVEYAKKKQAEEIKDNQLVELDSDYVELLNLINEKLQATAALPPSDDKEKEILRLKNLHKKTYDNYLKSKTAYMNLIK